MFARPPISLKGRALRLLSGREYSRAELERKLAPHEEAPGQLGRVLDELQAKDFIDDQRAADSLVHRRSGKLGAMRIRQELKAKGLADDIVQRAVTAVQATETERALEVWRKRFAAAPQDARERARQARFLAARGFGGDAIRRAIAGSVETDDAE